MTEEEWESTDHTQRMIFSIPKPLATHRKFRLFMAACCRVALHRHRPEVLEAIDLAEQFADGRVSMTELIQMWGQFREIRTSLPIVRLLCPDLTQMSDTAEQFCRQSGGWVIGPNLIDPEGHKRHVVRLQQRNGLLRCIFGNPFRPVAFDPLWRTETAVALAAGIYADRAFDRLPILADALEEAGCDHADVLTHCRGPRPHARGCWVVDAVLGKE